MWQAGSVTMVQMRVRMRTVAACEGLSPPTQMRRSYVTASGRSRTPSAAKNGKCSSCKKNKHKRFCLHVVRHDVWLLPVYTRNTVHSLTLNASKCLNLVEAVVLIQCDR